MGYGIMAAWLTSPQPCGSSLHSGHPPRSPFFRKVGETPSGVTAGRGFLVQGARKERAPLADKGALKVPAPWGQSGRRDGPLTMIRHRCVNRSLTIGAQPRPCRPVGAIHGFVSLFWKLGARADQPPGPFLLSGR